MRRLSALIILWSLAVLQAVVVKVAAVVLAVCVAQLRLQVAVAVWNRR